jgi:hypothetical protein
VVARMYDERPFGVGVAVLALVLASTMWIRQQVLVLRDYLGKGDAGNEEGEGEEDDEEEEEGEEEEEKDEKEEKEGTELSTEKPAGE